MNENLKPLYDLLAGQFGWMPQVVAWIGALRIAAKPFSAAVQTGVTKLVAGVLETPEPDDDAFVMRVLQSPVYRTLAFLLDWLASVKLPTTDSLKKATTPTTTEAKP